MATNSDNQKKSDEASEIENLRMQNEQLHEQVKRLITIERALLESDVSHTYRVKHIRLVNEFALQSTRANEIPQVFDLGIQLLLSAFAFDIAACIPISASGQLQSLTYRIRSSKKSVRYSKIPEIKVDTSNELFQKSKMLFKSETEVDLAAAFTSICRQILEEEEEDEGFDKAHKVLVTLPLRRKNGDLMGLIFGFCAAPDLKFAIELTLSQVPEAKDLEYINLCNSHIEAAVEKLILIRESHTQGVLQAEMEATKSIQERLLPENKSSPPGVTISSHYRPAATAGGDWYGYSYDLGNHALNIYIGDVTGHGVSSSIITGVACGAIYGAEAVNGHIDQYLPNSLKIEDKLKNLVSSINSVIYHTGRPNKLMTMAFLNLQLETGELTYINCGHPPLFILGSNKKVRGLILPSQHLGQAMAPELKSKKIQLQPGDTIFTYTDGLVENEGADYCNLGEKKLRQLLDGDATPADVQLRVLQAAEAIWRDASLDDDVTISVFQWHGPVSRQEFHQQAEKLNLETLWGIQYCGKVPA